MQATISSELVKRFENMELDVTVRITGNSRPRNQTVYLTDLLSVEVFDSFTDYVASQLEWLECLDGLPDGVKHGVFNAIDHLDDFYWLDGIGVNRITDENEFTNPVLKVRDVEQADLGNACSQLISINEGLTDRRLIQLFNDALAGDQVTADIGCVNRYHVNRIIEQETSI